MQHNHATGPSGAGKDGVEVMLDTDGYERLKASIKDADGLINRMIRARRIKGMGPPS